VVPGFGTKKEEENEKHNSEELLELQSCGAELWASVPGAAAARDEPHAARSIGVAATRQQVAANAQQV